MRWDDLFADLAAQSDAAESAEWDAEVAEGARHAVGRLALADRLRAVIGHPVRLTCLGAGRLHGRLDRVGPDWVLLSEGVGRELLVRSGAITSVLGLGRHAEAPPDGAVAVRLDLRYVLRVLARDRTPIGLTLTDGEPVGGTVDRVGADHLDLAEHPRGEPRRARSVRQVRTVPLGAVAAVRTD